MYSIENYSPIVMTLQPGHQQPRHSVPEGHGGGYIDKHERIHIYTYIYMYI